MLESYGITRPLLGWIKNFLSDRNRKVVLNESHTEWSQVTSGIPQGNVMVPIQFSIYINDQPEVVQNFSQTTPNFMQ